MLTALLFYELSNLSPGLRLHDFMTLVWCSSRLFGRQFWYCHDNVRNNTEMLRVREKVAFVVLQIWCLALHSHSLNIMDSTVD